MKVENIKQLEEMTIRSDFISNELAVRYEFTKEYVEKHGEYVGELNGIIFYKTLFDESILYGLFLQSNIQDENRPLHMKRGDFIGWVSITSIIHNSIEYIQFNSAYIIPEYRSKGYIAKSLFFIKNEEQKSIIDLGIVSSDGIQLYKNLHDTGRFKIYWLNLQTHEQDEFKNFNDKISDYRRTDWRIVIESFDKINFNDNFCSIAIKLFENMND